MGICIQYILYSLVLIFFILSVGGCQFFYLEKQYFLISCFLRVVCYFLFPTFLENKIFRGGGGGGSGVKMLAGDLGRPSCLVQNKTLDQIYGHSLFVHCRFFPVTGTGCMTWSPLACGVITGKYEDGVPIYSRAALKVSEIQLQGNICSGNFSSKESSEQMFSCIHIDF